MTLKELLKHRNMTGCALANLIGRKYGTIYGIFGGRRQPSIELGQVIAKATNSELVIEGKRFGWHPLPENESKAIVVNPATIEIKA